VLFSKLCLVTDLEPHAAALNMAIDEALLLRAEEPLLRVYSWSEPAVSFGYFGKYAEVTATYPGRELVRRWTGGGVVPHGEDITFSLLVPRGHPFASLAPLESYRAIHEAIAQWLSGRGVRATLSDGAPKRSEECFANPAPHDLLANGNKIVGGAQRRAKAGLLHQGSIQHLSGPDEWRHELAGAFASTVENLPLTREVLAPAESIAREKYGTTEWLQRW
jgi:lipoyl(octanoyl) transferase